MTKRRGKKKLRSVSSFTAQLQRAYDEVTKERVVAPKKISKAERRRIRQQRLEQDYRDYFTGRAVHLLRGDR